MEKQYRLIGKGGDIPFNEPVEGDLFFARMKFMGYVRDEAGEICGAKFLEDRGHGYGFRKDPQEVILHPGEAVQFFHSYTDTSDGTWENGSFLVEAQLVED